jgi:hypothetical protein
MVGSAVLVAPGVALAAAHCFIDLKPDEQGQCLGFTPSGPQLWEIRAIQPCLDTDLVILSLALRTPPPLDLRFPLARATTRTPVVGELLYLLGYSEEVDSAVDRPPNMTLKGWMYSACGPVIEVWEKAREAVMMPFPCFAVDCDTRGGMSGGPVFDSAGYLVGLLCVSRSDDPVSYVSAVWPAIGIAFEGGWPARAMHGLHALMDLDHSLCRIERPEAVSRAGSRPAKLSELCYAPWFAR